MPDEKTTPEPAFKVVEPEGGPKRYYANFSFMHWSGADITVDLYQLIQPNRDFPDLSNESNKILHDASVTMGWSAAKIFHTNLGEVLARYEKANGAIKTDFQKI